MITNPQIGLDPTSQERIDAANTLKYSLLLDYIPPEAPCDKLLVSRTLNACQACCRGLFAEKNATASYCFFGSKAEKKDARYSLSSLNQLPQPEVFYKVENLADSTFTYMTLEKAQKEKEAKEKAQKEEEAKEKAPKEKVKIHLKDFKFNTDSPIDASVGFHGMILQHCVLSSYHAILSTLLADDKVTAYQIKNECAEKGLYALQISNTSPIGIVGIDATSDEPSSNSQKSSKASDFSKIISSHIKALPGLTPLLLADTTDPKDLKKSPLEYRTQFSELCYRIASIRASDWKFLQNNKIKKGLEEIQKAEKLTQQLFYKKILPSDRFTGETLRTNAIDFLYHYYLAERTTNLNLFYSLLTNIYNIEQNTDFRLTQNNVLSILQCCKRLPNVFSRQYFIKYAFDQFQAKPESYWDFWTNEQLERSGIFLSSARGIPTGFQFPRWLKQYEWFCNYMSVFIIPVYEWCFITMLLTVIEKNYPDASHKDHLMKALSLLADYMREHIEEIVRPISMSINKEQDIVDLVTKHSNIERLANLPDSTVKYISNALFGALGENNETINLNLQPLNPAFFKWSKNPNAFEVNPARVRKFYMDLVRHTYLD